MPKQSIDFRSSISGIPCGIHIDHFICVPPFKGSPHQCDSADDFYGYTECDFTVLDHKGYEALWLEKRMTSSDEDRIGEEIATYKANEAEVGYDPDLDYNHDSCLDNLSDESINAILHTINHRNLI